MELKLRLSKNLGIDLKARSDLVLQFLVSTRGPLSGTTETLVLPLGQKLLLEGG